MSAAEAKRYLDARMRRRFDKHAMGWSLADAEAVRQLLTYTRELEARIRPEKVA